MESNSTLARIIVVVPLALQSFSLFPNKLVQMLTNVLEDWHIVIRNDSTFALLVVRFLASFSKAEIEPGMFIENFLPSSVKKLLVRFKSKLLGH